MAGPPPLCAAGDGVSLAFLGLGGDGVITLGEVLLAVAARAGLHGLLTKHYGPQIRGGESLARLRLAPQPTLAHADGTDVVVVLSLAEAHGLAGSGDGLTGAPGLILLVEQAEAARLTAGALQLVGRQAAEVEVVGLPLAELAGRRLRDNQARNVIALGAVAGLIGLPLGPLAEELERRLGRRPPLPGAAPRDLRQALELGLTELQKRAPGRVVATAAEVVPAEGGAVHPVVAITGNEALARGALDAGCRFFAGYPITPASDLLEAMTRWMPERGGQSVQAEDEMAACGMALGAAYGGVPAMTATSGPGLSLMQEHLGLASMAELPLVVVDVQRAGPATGIPTKTEQSDLLAAIWGAHGDAPRVVIAPRDAADAYRAGWLSQAVAEAYQLPVVVLSDQFLGQAKRTLSPDALEPSAGLRTGLGAAAERGPAPRAVPGQAGGMHYRAGIECDQHGHPSANAEVHQAGSERREQKLTRAAREVPLVGDVQLLGDAGPGPVDLAVITWGSSAGVLAEAIGRVAAAGTGRVRGLAPLCLHPLPARRLGELLDGAERLLVLELSHSGQLLRHLRAEMDLGPATSFRRAGGRPFGVDEVVLAMQKALAEPPRRR